MQMCKYATNLTDVARWQLRNISTKKSSMFQCMFLINRRLLDYHSWLKQEKCNSKYRKAIRICGVLCFARHAVSLRQFISYRPTADHEIHSSLYVAVTLASLNRFS